MRQRNQRTLAIFALAIALIATTVAYAVLQTSLNISASVTRKGGSWDIAIASVEVCGGPDFAYCRYTTNSEMGSGESTTINGTNASIELSLKPSEKRKVKVSIENRGTINANWASSNAFRLFFVGGRGEVTTDDSLEYEGEAALSGDGFLRAYTGDFYFTDNFYPGKTIQIEFYIDYLTNGETVFEEKEETLKVITNFVQFSD